MAHFIETCYNRINSSPIANGDIENDYRYKKRSLEHRREKKERGKNIRMESEQGFDTKDILYVNLIALCIDF